RSAVLAIGGAGALVLATTAATAILSRHSADAAPSISQAQHAVAGPAHHASAPAADSPAAARRFTGKVAANLSASMIAAGVPQRQGREYVALLARAIDLGGGLSVDDRFDLVIERRPDGTLGQLLYVGLDRVARADVELLKWTDGKAIIWVNADGVGGQDSAAMRLPVHGRLTSGFGQRFHPI